MPYNERTSVLYNEWELHDTVMRLVDAYKFSNQYTQSEKIQDLLPIRYAYGTYFPPKNIDFTNPKTDKVFTKTYKNEVTRVKAIAVVNKEIIRWNKWVEEYEKTVSIEQRKYHSYAEYEFWQLHVILDHSTIGGKDIKVESAIRTCTINSSKIYEKGLFIKADVFCYCFNKMIYDYLMYLANDIELSTDHLLWKPIKEFENWFMKVGFHRDGITSLMNYTQKDADPDAVALTEEETLSNELATAHSLLKKHKNEIRVLKKAQKVPAEQQIKDMIRNNTLDEFLKDYRKKASGKLNFSKLSKDLGASDKTIKKLLEQNARYVLESDGYSNE